MYKRTHRESTCKHGTSKNERARTVPLKPKIRPLQTWPRNSRHLWRLALQRASAQHVVRRVQMAAAGSCARKASVPRGPPPIHQPREGGRKGDLKREVLKPPRRAIHKQNLPPPLKAVLRMNPHGQGFPVQAVSLLQPPHKTRCAAVKKPCQAELPLRSSAAETGGGCFSLPDNTHTRDAKYPLKQTYLCKVIHLLQTRGNNRGLNYLRPTLWAHFRPQLREALGARG